MHTTANRTTILLAAAFVFSLGGLTPDGWARNQVEEFDEGEVFFEENTTDEDLGFHLFLDGEAWRRVMLFGPGDNLLLNVSVMGNLGMEIGLTELFSESAEPGKDEIPRQQFLDLFPEGTYTFIGLPLEGGWLVTSAELTHDIPDGPVILFPEGGEEIDPDQPLVVEWESVDDPDAPDSVVELYEVVAETDDDEDPFLETKILLPADATEVTLPAEFFQAGREYKVEIVVQESSGNRASAETEGFETEEED